MKKSILSSILFDGTLDRAHSLKIKSSYFTYSKYQKIFNEEKIQELSDSIVSHGLMQPIVVTRDQYRFITRQQLNEVKKDNAVVIIESLIGSLTDHEAHHVFYLLHTEVEERRKALEAKLNKLQGLNAHAIETLGVVSELAKELEV